MQDPSTISSYIGLTKRKDKLYYAKYSRSEIPFSGKKTHYYPNGELCFRGDYKDGKPDGIHEYYNVTGRVEKISYEYGEISSIEYYDENKRLMQITPYKNGVKHGISQRYNEYGKLTTKESFKNGVRHGWRSDLKWGTEHTWSHVFYKNDQLMGFDDLDEPKNENEIQESTTQLSLFT